MARKLRILLPVLAAAAGVSFLFLFLPKRKTLSFEATSEVLQVPNSGLAPDGRDETLCENTSLVYVEVTLQEIEPEEHVFDFSGVEETYHISKWKEMGKHMVLRLVLDDPSDTAHRDIPDWLYEKTGDGTDYDNAYGKGYCPDYSNPVLIEAHREAVEALAEWAEEDGFVSYVEIGSLGHWGEWHILLEDDSLPAFPDADVQQEYVDAYTESFQHAKLLMRRPFQSLPDGAGVYNDVTGDEEETKTWLSWISEGGTFDQTGEALEAVPDIWESAPVGGEFTSAIDMSELFGESYAATKELVQSSHMTFLGPKVPEEGELDEEERNNLTDLLTCIGPRYRISSLVLSGTRFGSHLTITLTNDGTCPVYFDSEKLILYITEADETEQKIVTDFDLTSIGEGQEETKSISLSMPYEELTASTIKAGIGTEEGTEKMPLFMDAEREDGLSLLCSPEVS